MKFTRTHIPEVIIIEPKVHSDERGYFMETYRHDQLEAFVGHAINFVQDSESISSLGTLRGLHYQLHPAAQTKLIRATQGKVLDIAVDIRQGSLTFGQYVAVELSAANKKQMFIPRGFAHGFLALEENTIVSYKADNYYSPTNERGIAYNDPTLNINWGDNKLLLKLSTKDKKQVLLAAAEIFNTQDTLYE